MSPYLTLFKKIFLSLFLRLSSKIFLKSMGVLSILSFLHYRDIWKFWIYFEWLSGQFPYLNGSYIILVLLFDISLAQWLFLEYHFKWWILYILTIHSSCKTANHSFIYTFIPSLVEAFAARRLLFLFSILYDISCSLDFSYFHKTYFNYYFISPFYLFVLIVIFILKLKKDKM